MEGIKDIETARRLPEIEDEMFRWRKEEQPDGTILNIPEIRPLCGTGVSGDDIMLFTDADGRFMKVVCIEDGWAKCKFRF